MSSLRLMPQTEEGVKADLEIALAHVREAGYSLPRDYGSFLREFSEEAYRELWEINGPLLQGLEQEVAEQGITPRSIADFCCGSGRKTVKIAELFPDAEIYGFDVEPEEIMKAKERTTPRVHFLERDVYRFRWGTYALDVVTFHNACGTLADKVIQYGTDHDVLVIAGKGCCHETIAQNPQHSQSRLYNWYLRGMNKTYDARYNAPRKGVDCDLLSVFARNSLGLDEQELERIVAIAIDVRLASIIIDLNRVMKLIERGYEVNYDDKNHIIVAGRKNPAEKSLILEDGE